MKTTKTASTAAGATSEDDDKDDTSGASAMIRNLVGCCQPGDVLSLTTNNSTENNDFVMPAIADDVEATAEAAAEAEADDGSKSGTQTKNNNHNDNNDASCCKGSDSEESSSIELCIVNDTIMAAPTTNAATLSNGSTTAEATEGNQLTKEVGSARSSGSKRGEAGERNETEDMDDERRTTKPSSATLLQILNKDDDADEEVSFSSLSTNRSSKHKKTQPPKDANDSMATVIVNNTTNNISATKSPPSTLEQQQKPEKPLDRNVKSATVMDNGSATILSNSISANNSNESSNNTTAAKNDNCCNLWWQQFWTLTRKNVQLKRRVLLGTILEIISPSVIMLILVIAHALATRYEFYDTTYDNLRYNITGKLLQVWVNSQPENENSATSMSGSTNTRSLLQQHMLQQQGELFEYDNGDIPSSRSSDDPSAFESWIQKIMFGTTEEKEDLLRSNEWIRTFNAFYNNHNDDDNNMILDTEEMDDANHYDDYDGSGNIRRRRQLQNSNDDEPEVINTTSSLDDIDYDFLQDIYTDIFEYVKQPITVPSMDQFVQISNLLSSNINVTALPRIFTDSDFGRKWGNLLTLGTIHLSPATNLRTIEFWDYLNTTYPNITFGSTLPSVDDDEKADNNDNNTTMSQNKSFILVRLHESEDAAIQYIDKYNRIERTWALIDFTNWPRNSADDSGGDDGNNNYKIRMNYTTIPNTAQVTNSATIGLSSLYMTYFFSGYLTLQKTINQYAFLQEASIRIADVDDNTTTVYDDINGTCMNVFPGFRENPDVWTMPMPTAAYSQNFFYLMVGFLLGFTIVMAYLFPFARLIKSLVEEKETKMKEILLIAGVYESAHWFSWLFFAMTVFVIISVLVSITLSINVMRFSHKLYIFVWIGAFSTSSVGLCFVTSAFFSKAKLASIIGPIALFATVLPRYLFFGFNRYEATTAKMWASLLPATAFAFGADIIADYEYVQVGVQPWNAGEGKYSFNTSIAFLLFDTVLYTALGWYLEQIFPRQFGKPKPWYFIISPWYWFGSCLKNKEQTVEDTVMPVHEKEGNSAPE